MRSEPSKRKLVAQATSFRFDGSDLMPGEVGGGSFWKGMTDYVSGAADLDQILPEIDASWPEGVAGQAQAEEATEEAAEEPAGEAMAMIAGGFMEQAMAGDFSGTVVTVDGPFADADTVKCEQGLVAFEEATGIDVQYIGGKEFEGSIGVRVEAGDAPDIADFPQPGLLATFVRQGYVVDVSTFLSDEWLAQQYNQSWRDMATIEGPDGPIEAGVFHRFNGKSLVWYPKDDLSLIHI